MDGMVIFRLLLFCLCHFWFASLEWMAVHLAFYSETLFTSGCNCDAIASVKLLNLESSEVSNWSFNQWEGSAASGRGLVLLPLDVKRYLFTYDDVPRERGAGDCGGGLET